MSYILVVYNVRCKILVEDNRLKNKAVCQHARLFADDTIVYRRIRYKVDTDILLSDLDDLQR